MSLLQFGNQRSHIRAFRHAEARHRAEALRQTLDHGIHRADRRKRQLCARAAERVLRQRDISPFRERQRVDRLAGDGFEQLAALGEIGLDRRLIIGIGLAVFQYFTSDKLALAASGAKVVTGGYRTGRSTYRVSPTPRAAALTSPTTSPGQAVSMVSRSRPKTCWAYLVAKGRPVRAFVTTMPRSKTPEQTRM